MEAVKGVRKLASPIALAIVWVMMAALAMVDFASFTASTSARPARLERKLPEAQPERG